MKPDPRLPRTVHARAKLAMESTFCLCVAAYAVFHWPPDGVKAKGLWADVFLAILLEMMIAVIPLSVLSLWWCASMPTWIEDLIRRASHHVDLAAGCFFLLGLFTMIAAMLGWL